MLKRMGKPRLLALITWAAICTNGPLQAQTGQDTIRIQVVDAERREPLAEAEIRWNGAAVGRTDTSGRFFLLSPSNAPGRVLLSRLGFQAIELQVLPGGDRTLYVELHAQPVSLPKLEVEAAGRVRSPALKEFYRRVQTGAGRYFTREAIDRARPRDVADLLRTLPSMEIHSNSQGDKPQFVGDNPRAFGRMGREKEECPILYFLDGAPFQPTHGSMIGLDVRPQELEGIEVYRNGSSAPGKYTRGRAACGVILLWKRERI